ncbi:MAG: PASTA domain-containing protein [Polaribacter sp.]|nr:PASTA domain-containing protein [Polaribacter sp.]
MSLRKFLFSKIFVKQVVISLIILFVFVFTLKIWLGFTTNHNQQIQVPDLQKLSISEASEKLSELNLDFVVVDSANYNPDYPKKSVIEQNPLAGDFVKENRKIYLTLNPSKYRDVTLPNLFGKTKRQAMSNLKAIGLKVSETFEYVPDIGLDVVRGVKFSGKNLNEGDKIPLNSTVTLVLGDGYEDRKIDSLQSTIQENTNPNF